MSDIAIAQLVWFCIGCATGALACVGWILARGGQLGPAPEAPAALPPIHVSSMINVDWALIHAALKGAGMTAVYTEEAAKLH